MNATTTKQPSDHAPNDATGSEMGNLIADIEQVLGKAGHVMDMDVTRLRESLRQKIASARSAVSAGGQRITEAAGTAASATDDYVRRSPWQAAGIAAIAGLTVGYLLARRRE